MKTRKFFYYGKFGVLGIIFLIGFTFVVMWLWNGLIPELFNGPVVTYWQTLGLLILSKIIFSGIGGRGGSHSSDKHDHRWKGHEKWRKRFEEKMNGVAEERKDDGEVFVAE